MTLTWRQCQAIITPSPFLSCATSCISSVQTKFPKYHNWVAADARKVFGWGLERKGIVTTHLYCSHLVTMWSLFINVPFQVYLCFRLNSTNITRWIELQKMQWRCLGGDKGGSALWLLSLTLWRLSLGDNVKPACLAKSARSCSSKLFGKKHLFQKKSNWKFFKLPNIEFLFFVS